MAEAGDLIDSVESLQWELLASRKENERMTGLLTYDRLTGLYKTEDYGRQAILSKIEAAVNNGKDLAIAIMDLKEFKRVNDRYDHRTGDEVLKAVAERLKELAGSDGLAMRSHYQGDEIGILFVGENCEAKILALQELQNSGIPWKTEKTEGRISFTLGVSRLADLSQGERETVGDVFQRMWQRASFVEREQHGSKNG